MRKYIKLSLIILLLGSSISLRSQVLPVGTLALEDYYRRQQLLGQLDSTVSFSVRPLTNEVLKQRNIFNPETSYTDNSIYHFPNGKGFMQVMPIQWQNQVTTSYPYGWNDGGMIPAVGYQTMLSAGLYAQYKWLSIQLRPELVYAQNKSYAGYNGSDFYAWEKWYDITNNIDMPEHFGEGAYTRFLPGQSSIRANFDPISIGISTENLWWGPGMQNSLLMTNTAPGFLHATVNTTRPIRTGIGSFEGQVIAGRLNGSGYTPTILGRPDNYDQLYIAKPDDWRYISGAQFAYQPKWLPGLSLGIAQSFIVYSKDMGNGLNDILPFLGPGSNSPTQDPGNIMGPEQRKKRDRYSSFFARLMMPESHSEFYIEYGRNDPAWNTRDALVEADHSRAYVLGVRKLVPLKATGQMLSVNVEFTQMERARTAAVRTSPSWYANATVRHGYTNLGQILGAGIGPGANLQVINFSWIKGMKSLGFEIQRLEHNSDYYYSENFPDIRANWVDLSGALLGVYDYKNFIFQAKLHYIHAYNYQYELVEKTADRQGFWDFIPQDKTNFQAQLGLMYRF